MLNKLGYFTRPIAHINISQSTFNTTLWKPTDLSSLYGWWDASDLTTIEENNTAGRVSKWNDKSIFGNHLYQATATNEPLTGTEEINALNTLDFGNGNAHFLSPNGSLNSALNGVDIQDISIHIIFKQSSVSSNGALISFKNTNGSDSVIPNFDASNKYYGPEDTGVNTYRIIDPSPFNKGNPHLLTLEGDATDIRLYKNGTLEYAEGNAASTNHFNLFVIGFRVSASQLWRGSIGEIIISKSLNKADRQSVEGYLANKWGV